MGVSDPLLSPRVNQCLLCVSLVVDDYMCPLKRALSIIFSENWTEKSGMLQACPKSGGRGGAGQGRRPGKVVWSCSPAEDLVLKCEGRSNTWRIDEVWGAWERGAVKIQLQRS